MNVQTALAVGKKLLLGMAQPVNKDMYEAVGATIQELWGDAGYAAYYDDVEAIGSHDDDGWQYILPDPERTHQKLVALYA